MSEREQQRPRERAQKIVSDLAKRGESRTKDIQRSAREFAERSARNRRELVGLVQKEIRRQIKALGLTTREEIDRLQRRVRDLERKPKAKPEAQPKAKPKPKAKAKPKPKPKKAKPKSSPKRSPGSSPKSTGR